MVEREGGESKVIERQGDGRVVVTERREDAFSGNDQRIMPFKARGRRAGSPEESPPAARARMTTTGRSWGRDGSPGREGAPLRPVLRRAAAAGAADQDRAEAVVISTAACSLHDPPGVETRCLLCLSAREATLVHGPSEGRPQLAQPWPEPARHGGQQQSPPSRRSTNSTRQC